MDERMKKLKEFVEKYCEDYVSDGTKNEVLIKLENGDKNIFNMLVSAMDEGWIRRVKEVGKFRAFANTIQVARFEARNDKNKEHYSANYMDDRDTGEKRIPVLKHIVPRIIDLDITRDHIER